MTDLDAPGLDPSGQLEREAQPSLFNRRDWFRMASRHGGETPLVARAASEGALAWLFLQRNGKRARSLSNWYSFAFGPVLAGRPEEARAIAMLVAICRRLRAARPRIVSLELNPVPDGERNLLETALRRGGWWVSASKQSVSWTANVAGRSFDDYWKARPGDLRSTFKRKAAKLDYRVQIHTRFDEGGWGDYQSVYADSWKPDEGAPEMLREMAEREGAAGTLRLGLLHVEGQPIAAQLWTVENGRALIHKLAYRESAKDYSPGTLLSEAMFRNAIEVDKVELIDFGTGDDAYKAAWMEDCAPLWRVEAFNPGTLAGALRIMRRKAARLVRRTDNG